MKDDRFFRADAAESVVPEWDGTPKLRMTEEQANTLLDFVPHWHACLLGPVPLGGDPEARVKFQIDYLLTGTRDAAEQQVWLKVAQVCDVYNHPFIPDEWDVIHLVAMNCG